MMPKATKSVAMTMMVIIHEMAATAAAKLAPQKPEPIARRKAMNARPVAMGWRIMTRVRALEVSIEAVVKVVWSMPSMMTAGL